MRSGVLLCEFYYVRTFYKLVNQIRKVGFQLDNVYTLYVPELKLTIESGCHLKLGRFEVDTWIAEHGWYSCNGNRPVCGWYLINIDNPAIVKPLQKPDLDDIYLIEV